MVVCKKKNGQPRRTVDLQALNVHCKRETHHTPSPFHQAMSVPSGKKKSVSMHGTATTLFQSENVITTSPPSHHAADIDTAQPPKDMLPQGTVTQEDSTKLWWTSQIRQSALMTLACGLTQLRNAFSRHVSG